MLLLRNASNVRIKLWNGVPLLTPVGNEGPWGTASAAPDAVGLLQVPPPAPWG